MSWFCHGKMCGWMYLYIHIGVNLKKFKKKLTFIFKLSLTVGYFSMSLNSH